MIEVCLYGDVHTNTFLRMSTTPAQNAGIRRCTIVKKKTRRSQSTSAGRYAVLCFAEALHHFGRYIASTGPTRQGFF